MLYGSTCAINAEWKSALGIGRACFIKHQTIRTEMFRHLLERTFKNSSFYFSLGHLSVATLVVSVTLQGVSKVAILLRTLGHVIIVRLTRGQGEHTGHEDQHLGPGRQTCGAH